MSKRTRPFLEAAYQRTPQDPTDDTNYFYGTGGNALGTQSGAAISVSPPETSYAFPTYGGHSRDAYYAGGNDAYGDRDNSEGAPEGTTWADRNAEPNGQIPLFTANHKPPVMNYMVSTKDSNSKAMDLAAHAAEETRIRYGERPWASSSLSAYSKPVVNHGIKAGIIKGIFGRAEGELDLSDSDNGYDWAQGHSGVQDATARLNAHIDDDGDPISANRGIKRIDPKTMAAHKGTIKAELAHKQAADRLGIPRTSSPSVISDRTESRVAEFKKNSPQLDFGDWA